jgi:hypothetical protein
MGVNGDAGGAGGRGAAAVTATETRPRRLEPTAVAEAKAALEAAHAARAVVLDRIGLGEDVGVTEHAEVEHAVEHAETVFAARSEAWARQVEADRMAEAETLRSSIDAGKIAAERAELVELFDAAVAALGDLQRAAHAHRVGLTSALERLGRLAMAGPEPAGGGPMPAGVDLEWQMGRRVGRRLSDLRAVSIDGTYWRIPPADLAALLVAEAAAALVAPKELEQLARRVANRPDRPRQSERLRAPDAIGDDDV